MMLTKVKLLQKQKDAEHNDDNDNEEEEEVEALWHRNQSTKEEDTTHLGNSAQELQRLPQAMVVYCTNMMNSATSEVQLGIQYKFKELCHQSRAFHHGIHLSIKLHSTTFSKDTNLQFICETEYI